MHDTKMYEAESDSTEKNWPGINHKMNDWLINQISTGIYLPNYTYSDDNLDSNKKSSVEIISGKT